MISVLGVPGCVSYTFLEELTYVELGPRTSSPSFSREVCAGRFDFLAEGPPIYTPIRHLESEDLDLVAFEDFELKYSSGLCAMMSGTKVRLEAEQ